MGEPRQRGTRPFLGTAGRDGHGNGQSWSGLAAARTGTGARHEADETEGDGTAHETEPPFGSRSGGAAATWGPLQVIRLFIVSGTRVGLVG